MKDYCYVTKKPGGVFIEPPYHPDFLEVFKRHVPAAHREWAPDLKCWWVSEEYAAQAITDAKAFFNEIIEV